MNRCHYCDNPIRGIAGKDWFLMDRYRPFTLDLYHNDDPIKTTFEREYVCNSCKYNVTRDKREWVDIESEIFDAENPNMDIGK